ncbi:MAG: hypothetical protein ACP5IT_11115 [Thermoproteota archaeon]
MSYNILGEKEMRSQSFVKHGEKLPKVEIKSRKKKSRIITFIYQPNRLECGDCPDPL